MTNSDVKNLYDKINYSGDWYSGQGAVVPEIKSRSKV